MGKIYLLKTLPKLGLLNIARVVAYRLGVKLGLNPVMKLEADKLPSGSLFFSGQKKPARDLLARKAWLEYRQYFGAQRGGASDEPPNWHQSCITGAVADASKPWFQLSDFDAELGDIKGVWEASRMDWVLAFAQHAANGDAMLLQRLNTWIDDWCQHNPPYYGVNWKCGQEASIRVMHLLMAAFILNEHLHPQASLIQLIKIHLQRIAPTIMYAVAQDNNHATSEAVALFIGGTWLESLGDSSGKVYAAKGRKWLENRAKHLIMEDGTFSQYSVNYHRVMLDTYTWAEIWRSKLDLPPFSKALYQRLKAVTDWLMNMVMGLEGDAPVQGANDGARLIPLTDTSYRDYRPSVQLATAVFHKKAAYLEASSYDLPLAWLDIAKPAETHNAVSSKNYPLGGYAILRNAKAGVLFKYPRYQFRPSSGDYLHIDLWLDGQCVLVDSGSYSYNTEQRWQDYFQSMASHNTVQFDEREAMPRLSRFLLGEWLRSVDVKFAVLADKQTAAAAYKDYLGASHKRELELGVQQLVVKDTISGFKQQAVLRWRLVGENWQLTEQGATNGAVSIIVSSEQKQPLIMALNQAWISKRYSEKEAIQVLEVTVKQQDVLLTEVKF